MESDASYFVSRSIESAALLFNQAGADGLSADDVLRGTGLQAADFHDSLREIGVDQELQLVRNLLALGVPSSFAFRTGLRCRSSRLGLLGYALLHGENIRSVTELCLRFMPLTFSFCRVRVTQQDAEVHINFDCELMPKELADFMVVRDMGTLAALIRDITGRRFPLRRWTVAAGDTGQFAGSGRFIVCAPQFMMPANAWVLDQNLMDYPLPQANPRLYRQCVDACETLLEHKQALVSIVGQVRNLLMRSEARVLSLEQLAEQFHCTPRTLRRRLEEADTSYRDLASEARHALAVTMLHDRRYSLGEISERLGYRNASSFTTAFRRWTGKTPSEYRIALSPADGCGIEQ